MSQNRSTLPLVSLNHVSRVCKSVKETKRFYEGVLGFVEIVRPNGLIFEGAWLHGYGMGVHLIAGQPERRSATINPKMEHISFVATSMEAAEAKLQELNIRYIKDKVVHNSTVISQLFFHDPDRNLIEICNCDVMPIMPLNAPVAMQAPAYSFDALLPSTASPVSSGDRSHSMCSQFSDRSSMEEDRMHLTW